MQKNTELHTQLRRIGHNNWFYARAEIQQLPHILLDDEVVFRVVTGGCPDGIAILVATNRRLLLVDKSPFTLDIEDFPYAHIANAEHKFGFIFGTIKVCTLNRELVFTRVNPRKIGEFAKFVHYKIREASDSVRRITEEINPEEIRHRSYPGVYKHGATHTNPFAPKNSYEN